jgi:CheY-like chemotaxis protein
MNDFDAIVSDIDMPVMDGIEFYNEALKIKPHINSRFLFYIGSTHEDHEIFFMKNNVSFLHKSSKIEDVKSSIRKILDRSFQEKVEGRN